MSSLSEKSGSFISNGDVDHQHHHHINYHHHHLHPHMHHYQSSRLPPSQEVDEEDEDDFDQAAPTAASTYLTDLPNPLIYSHRQPNPMEVPSHPPVVSSHVNGGNRLPYATMPRKVHQDQEEVLRQNAYIQSLGKDQEKGIWN